MESPETTTNNKQASLDSDPRLALVRQRHAELRDHLEGINASFRTRSSSETRLSHVFQYIESTFFYESAARFGFATRLNRFYSSLRIGNRFVAKVISVFERSADVRIIWSPKRDVRDLKVKAVLRMVESKRYNNGHRSSESYRRQNSDAQQNRNLDVSELIYVELVSFNDVNRKMEVIRCNSLIKSEDRSVEESQEDDDTMLNEDKYLAKSSSESFHEYMMNHRDLNNPSLVKRQICSSLIHRKLVVQSHEKKLAEGRKRSNDKTTTQEDDDVVFLDEQKSANESLSAGSKRKHSETQPRTKNSPKSEISNNGESSKNSDYSYPESRKRTPVSSERADQIQKERRSYHRSPSLLSLSSSSSESSSSSSNDSRKRHKHKKHKHKGHSKKHSKKSKKKKSRKHRRRDSSSRRSKSPGPKKIDNKILELLNMTK